MQNLYLIMDIRFQYFLVTLALALQCIPVAAAQSSKIWIHLRISNIPISNINQFQFQLRILSRVLHGGTKLGNWFRYSNLCKPEEQKLMLNSSFSFLLQRMMHCMHFQELCQLKRVARQKHPTLSQFGR